MTAARVHCTSCDRQWHSRTMAEGLRALAGCPRCGGELEFAPDADAVRESDAAAREPVLAGVGVDASPSRILGVPRRSSI